LDAFCIRSVAAKDLDISRATLHRKLKQLGLHR
jgi:transcriptional regulator of acetoin/glycerol metabolism